MSHSPAAFSSHGDQVKIVRLSGDRQRELDKLPSPKTRRWVMRRKAQVVNAVQNGLLSREEAMERYSLSEEEFTGWLKLMERHGLRGLRATRLQEYRGPTGEAVTGQI